MGRSADCFTSSSSLKASCSRKKWPERLEEPNITIQFVNNLSQSSAEIMQLSSDWRPTAARERDANRTTSEETRQDQKTAGFLTLKGHSRVKRERDLKHKNTVNAHLHRKAKAHEKHRGNTLRVDEKLSRPAKTTPALRKITTRHGHRTTHESDRKHEGVEK